MKDLALGLVKHQEVHMQQLLQPAKVLDGIPSLLSTNHTTQPGVICKLAEGALETSACVIDENI